MRGFRLLLIPVALGLVLVAGVLWALSSAARPTLTRVEIQVGYPQRAAQVEADIAVPLEDALQGMPHLARIESVSSHGQALLAASFGAKAPRAKLAEEVRTRSAVFNKRPSSFSMAHVPVENPAW